MKEFKSVALDVPKFDALLRQAVLDKSETKAQALRVVIYAATDHFKSFSNINLKNISPKYAPTVAGTESARKEGVDLAVSGLKFLSMVTWDWNKTRASSSKQLFRTTLVSNKLAATTPVGSSFMFKHVRPWASWTEVDLTSASFPDLEEDRSSGFKGPSKLTPIVVQTKDHKGKVVWAFRQSDKVVKDLVDYVAYLLDQLDASDLPKETSDRIGYRLAGIHDGLIDMHEQLSAKTYELEKEWILYHPNGIRVTRVK